MSGGDLAAVAERLRGRPGVEQVAAFGSTLHVTGRDAGGARGGAARAPSPAPTAAHEPAPTGLEDVFIHLTEQSVDNFGPKAMKRSRSTRWWGIVLKEFLQLKRDRITFGMVVGIPIIQIVLFGYAINTDPKHLPTAVVMGDRSEFTRSYLAAMKTSGYFVLVDELPDEAAARAALARGDVQFVVSFPADFTRRLLRGERPAMLIEADATDPAATGAALASVRELAASVAQQGPHRRAGAAGRRRRRRSRCACTSSTTPRASTQHNIVPGLMGVILTMTMVMMTGLAMTRERERGTMENLLAMPAQPLEVMTGKIVPYIFIGLVQATIILLAALLPVRRAVRRQRGRALRGVAAVHRRQPDGRHHDLVDRAEPAAGDAADLLLLPADDAAVGLHVPVPGHARAGRSAIGNVLPATYFMRLVRGILLKGNDWADLWPNIWPLMVFTVVMMTIAMIFYRRTLD